jgi:hypothetical protein
MSHRTSLGLKIRMSDDIIRVGAFHYTLYGNKSNMTQLRTYYDTSDLNTTSDVASTVQSARVIINFLIYSTVCSRYY